MRRRRHAEGLLEEDISSAMIIAVKDERGRFCRGAARARDAHEQVRIRAFRASAAGEAPATAFRAAAGHSTCAIGSIADSYFSLRRAPRSRAHRKPPACTRAGSCRRPPRASHGSGLKRRWRAAARSGDGQT